MFEFFNEFDFAHYETVDNNSMTYLQVMTGD